MTLKFKMLALTMSALALWATPCTAIEVGQAAPDIALPDSALASQLSQLRGRHVYLDFWASWCGPCQRFSPIYEDASGRHSDVTFAKVDTEDQQELSAGLEITSIPTIMAFRAGYLVFRQSGLLG